MEACVNISFPLVGGPLADIRDQALSFGNFDIPRLLGAYKRARRCHAHIQNLESGPEGGRKSVVVRALLGRIDLFSGGWQRRSRGYDQRRIGVIGGMLHWRVCGSRNFLHLGWRRVGRRCVNPIFLQWSLLSRDERGGAPYMAFRHRNPHWRAGRRAEWAGGCCWRRLRGLGCPVKDDFVRGVVGRRGRLWSGDGGWVRCDTSPIDNHCVGLSDVLDNQSCGVADGFWWGSKEVSGALLSLGACGCGSSLQLS